MNELKKQIVHNMKIDINNFFMDGLESVDIIGIGLNDILDYFKGMPINILCRNIHDDDIYIEFQYVGDIYMISTNIEYGIISIVKHDIAF